MSRRAQYEILAGLKEAQERFSEWRSSHSGRRPIPEPLWALARKLAGQHGVFRTAQMLRLDYTTLKRRTQAVAPVGKQPCMPTTAFVDSWRPLPRKVRMRHPGGRAARPNAVEWKGPAAPDLLLCFSRFASEARSAAASDRFSALPDLAPIL